MCKFMEVDIEQKLKDENLELKLSAIRASIETIKDSNKVEHDEIMNELHSILQHVKKTNGSVARVTERLARLEQDKLLKDKELQELAESVAIESKQTKLWRTISSNKWVMILLLVFIYMLGSNMFRDVIFQLITKIR